MTSISNVGIKLIIWSHQLDLLLLEKLEVYLKTGETICSFSHLFISLDFAFSQHCDRFYFSTLCLLMSVRVFVSVCEYECKLLLLEFQLALAVTNPLPLFAYVDTLTGGDTCESLTYSYTYLPYFPYFYLKSPYHITYCRAFLCCCWPGAKFLIFVCELENCAWRVASCHLWEANHTARLIHFNFHFPSSTKQIHREFLYFCSKALFWRSQRFTNLFPAQATTRVTAVSWALPKYWQLSCVICKSLCQELNSTKCANMVDLKIP